MLKVQDLTQTLQQLYLQHLNTYGSNNQYIFDAQEGDISAFEPIKVSVNFESENAGYSNLAGAVLLSDLLNANPNTKLFDLFRDNENPHNGTWNGVESGILTPFFAGDYAPNGAFLDQGNGTIDLYPTSITLLPGDEAAFYLATGYGHNPNARVDYLFSTPEIGSVKHGTLPPEGSYVKITDNGNGQYQVAWEDLTGGGDRDFNDVILDLSIQRIPLYDRTASLEVPATATENNTFAFQVNDAVIEAWYATTPTGEEGLYFKVSALNDFTDGYTIQVTDQNGNLPPAISNNPYKTPTLAQGESDIEYFAPVEKDASGNIIPLTLSVTAPVQNVATIEKRAVVGYNQTTVTFGSESQTFQLPQLDVVQKADIEFGKLSVLLPAVKNDLTNETAFNQTLVQVTVPKEVIHENITPNFTPEISQINIPRPEKPTKPNREDFASDQEYAQALEQYAKDLENYKIAEATYKVANKSQEWIAKGAEISLKVEKAAINAVNKIIDGYLVKGLSKLQTTFKAKMDELNDKKAHFEQLVQNLQSQLASTTDPTQRQILQEKISAYSNAVKELTEANANLGKEAISFAKEMIDGFKKDMQDLLSEFRSGYEKNNSSALSYSSQAQSLLSSGVQDYRYYEAAGQAVLYDEIASGFKVGEQVIEAVLDTFNNVDISANPDIADALPDVDISQVNIQI